MTTKPPGRAGSRETGGGSAPVSQDATRPIVAFDFDGTLTVRDSFNAFLLEAAPGSSRLRLLRLFPELLAYAVLRNRGRLKAEAVRVRLRGWTREELAAQTQAFAEHHAATLLRPDALEAWAAHRAQGDRLVIVTASPEQVVQPFAARLGADALIGTRLTFDAADRVTGGLDGPNCRGLEKVNRLRAAFGPGVRLAAAYGDTAGDREMLAIADHAYMRRFTGRASRRA